MFATNLQKSHEKIIAESILPGCFFSIVIPIRNEARHLFRLLKSLSEQSDYLYRSLDFRTFETIFLVNNTFDNSAEIIRQWQTENPSFVVHLAEKNLPIEHSNIGFVRRWLMNEAFLRLRNNKFNGGIIATTDGDTELAPKWICSIVKEIQKGAEAVGGRIYIHSSDLKNMDARARAFHLRDTGYRLLAAEIETSLDYLAHDSFPRHHQHFNGSFAVTTAAFKKAGGIPKVNFLEDVAFYHSLLRVDARFRHSPLVRAQTSARLDGRVEVGLSTQINEWTLMGDNGDKYLVESASAINRRLSLRNNLRNLRKNANSKNHLSDEIKMLADKLMITGDFLQNELNDAPTFGVFYEKILNEQHRIGDWQRENPPENVEKVVFDLRLALEKSRYRARNLFD